jgi:16S rRNA (guanine527-N7)-methyltransferase
MQLIQKYFPDLTPRQLEQFAALDGLYRDWNEKINVISRKDIDHLYEHHVLHSLAIAKFIQFKNATKIMDLGTGGGFPGIPLAIMFPECRFHLVDSIAKKLKVIDAVSEALELKNMFTFHSRVEQMPYQYDFIVTRAVAQLSDLLAWTKGKSLYKDQNALPNGLIALKGGDLAAELAAAEAKLIKQLPLSVFFKEDFFKDKSLVYVKL